jgi:cardiolipin synthase
MTNCSRAAGIPQPALVSPTKAIMITTLPNLLTLSRILVIPLFIAAFYLSSPLSNWVAFGIFVVAGITDFFDGYLARNLNQVSNLGRFLDPIADKLLVAAAILMLVAVDRIEGWTVLPAMVILCGSFWPKPK